MKTTWNVGVDAELAAEQLDDKYNPEGDGEHPAIPRKDWRRAVQEEETLKRRMEEMVALAEREGCAYAFVKIDDLRELVANLN